MLNFTISLCSYICKWSKKHTKLCIGLQQMKLFSYNPVCSEKWKYCKQIGSCVLKASTVDCRSIPLIDTQSTLHQHLSSLLIDTPPSSWLSVGQDLTNFWLIDMSRSTLTLLTDCWSSVDKVLIECRPSINWDVERVLIEISIESINQEYRSTFQWLRIPLVHMTQQIYSWTKVIEQTHDVLWLYCKKVNILLILLYNYVFLEVIKTNSSPWIGQLGWPAWKGQGCWDPYHGCHEQRGKLLREWRAWQWKSCEVCC